MNHSTAVSRLDRTPDNRSSPATDSPKIILLVDDDIDCRNLLHQVLELTGFSVLSAAHPYQAIEIARNTTLTIDLLISDMVMPDQNGLELYRNLRVLLPMLPVLFISGCPDFSSCSLGSDETAVNFLLKPFRINIFLETVRKLVET